MSAVHHFFNSVVFKHFTAQHAIRHYVKFCKAFVKMWFLPKHRNRGSQGVRRLSYSVKRLLLPALPQPLSALTKTSVSAAKYKKQP